MQSSHTLSLPLIPATALQTVEHCCSSVDSCSFQLKICCACQRSFESTLISFSSRNLSAFWRWRRPISYLQFNDSHFRIPSSRTCWQYCLCCCGSSCSYSLGPQWIEGTSCCRCSSFFVYQHLFVAGLCPNS